MKKFLLISCAFVFSFCINTTTAQSTNPPFYNDIQKFKNQDSINPPPQNGVLFVGSSSFTKWTDVQNYFPNVKIINRGFGGSILPDVIRYANDIIFHIIQNKW